MNLKQQKGIESIEIGDRLFSQLNEESVKQASIQKYMSKKELQRAKRLLGSQLGLVCEYYLKGIILPDLTIECPEDDELLKQVISNLSEEEEYEIIIGNESIINELAHKYNIPKKKLKTIQENSLKKLGHAINNLIARLSDSHRIKSTLALQSIIDYDEFNKSLGDINHENVQTFMINEFLKYLIKHSSEKVTEDDIKSVEDTIDNPEVKNAFSSGRYGHLDSYVPDTDYLFLLAETIRAAIKDSYLAIDLRYGNLKSKEAISNKIYIFPDEDSKIYVTDSGDASRISRVYQVKKQKKYIEEHPTFDSKYKNKGYGYHDLWLEFGYQNAESVALNSTMDSNTLCNQDNILTVIMDKEKSETPVIICQINGEYIAYSFSHEGKIFEADPSQRMIETIEAYERNPDYPDRLETQIIEKSIELQLRKENLFALSMIAKKEGKEVNPKVVDLVGRPTFEGLEKRVPKKRIFDAILDKLGIRRRLIGKSIDFEKGDNDRK